MNVARYKFLGFLLFTTVLLVKLFIALCPVLLEAKNQAVIQYEKENKSDKDDSGKESIKDKKFVDEDFVYYLQHPQLASFTFVINKLNFKQPLYLPNHYATVQTPPPDGCMA